MEEQGKNKNEVKVSVLHTMDGVQECIVRSKQLCPLVSFSSSLLPTSLVLFPVCEQEYRSHSLGE